MSNFSTIENYMFISLVFALLLPSFIIMGIIHGYMNRNRIKISNSFGHHLFCIVLFPFAEIRLPPPFDFKITLTEFLTGILLEWIRKIHRSDKTG